MEKGVRNVISGIHISDIKRKADKNWAQPFPCEILSKLIQFLLQASL
jgi:hypothetical protein